jgi:Raf kinase inhibitor-like YbhB/YbcL family protein
MAGMHLGDLTVTTPAFGPGDPIPSRHTTEGDDVSPAVEWSNVPDGTRQLALVVHDPDAPLTDGFTHWVVYGIPADAGGIGEGEGPQHTEGRNDFGGVGYNGPAPPPGHGRHHYFFHLYALDSELDAGPGLTRAELLERIDEHIIEQARVVGTFER